MLVQALRLVPPLRYRLAVDPLLVLRDLVPSIALALLGAVFHRPHSAAHQLPVLQLRWAAAVPDLPVLLVYSLPMAVEVLLPRMMRSMVNG